MDWATIRQFLTVMQHIVSFIGVAIILSGIFFAFLQYIYYFSKGFLYTKSSKFNEIRLELGRILILGLEFIVAADLIGTTTTPDYYSLGILAIIVLIRTFLSFSINREIQELTKEQRRRKEV